MADNVYTPGQSAPKKGMNKKTKTWLLIGGFAVAGVVVWYVVKSRSGSSTTAAASQDPSIDPATGIPYSQEYGGGAMGTTPSLYGYQDPGTGAFISGVGSGGVVTTPTTNASWAQQVEAYLQSLGYDPTTVAAALGKYLTGQTLTADQASIVAAAQGFYGNPPQGAPNSIVGTPIGNGTGGGSTNTGAPGGHHMPKEIHAPGGLTIAQIASELGLRWKNLQTLNPNLRKYFGKKVPKGTPVRLY